jgi:hypothetical protein
MATMPFPSSVFLTNTLASEMSRRLMQLLKITCLTQLAYTRHYLFASAFADAGNCLLSLIGIGLCLSTKEPC